MCDVCVWGCGGGGGGGSYVIGMNVWEGGREGGRGEEERGRKGGRGEWSPAEFLQRKVPGGQANPTSRT